MLTKILDITINALTKLKNKLEPETVDSNATDTKTLGSLSSELTLKKRGRPKLTKPSTDATLSKKLKRQKSQNGSIVQPKIMHKRGRNPELTLKTVEQVDKLKQEKNMTIAEACKKIGLSQGSYYRLKARKGSIQRTLSRKNH